jgi:hypothetical protein
MNNIQDEKMDGQTVGKLLVTIFLSFKFFLMPLFTGIISIIKIFSTKNIIKKAGINYCKSTFKVNKKYYEVMIFILSLLIILSIFLFLLGEGFVPIICSGFILYLSGNLFIYKLYGNIVGIYENGIINADNNLMNWNEIHSYKIEGNNIKGYFSKGNIFEFTDIQNISEIKNLFEKNNIMKRE